MEVALPSDRLKCAPCANRGEVVTLSRREFTALVGAGALGATSQETNIERPSAERVGAMLDALGDRGIFSDPEWLELLRRGIELNARTRATLRHYALTSDTEPTITFARY